jgi:RNA polymerase sigma factor (sigma-70 family)
MNTARPYDQIYEEYSGKIYRYFRYRVKNIWDVEDLTTTVFLKVFSKLEQYDGRNPFGAWIFRIAHNTFVDFLRKKRECPVESETFVTVQVDEQHLPEQRLLSKESWETVWENVKFLSADQRRVISLRYRTNLRMNEIAKIMGKTEASVKVIHHRGLKKLQQLMASHR